MISGAACGFLVHNFPPASIFMGDAGSLVLGFALAGTLAQLPRTARRGRGRSSLRRSPSRSRSSTPPSSGPRGGGRGPAVPPRRARPHDAPPRRARALREADGPRALRRRVPARAAALAVARGGLGTAVLVALGVAVGLLLCGVFLSDVRVYKGAVASAPGASPSAGATTGGAPPNPLPHPDAVAPVLYAVELAVDVAVFTGAWVAAYVVKFADSGSLEDYLAGLLPQALPFVIGLKVLALLSQGLYRGVWRSIRFDDLFRIVKACALGTVLVIATAAGRGPVDDYSREVFAPRRASSRRRESSSRARPCARSGARSLSSPSSRVGRSSSARAPSRPWSSKPSAARAGRRSSWSGSSTPRRARGSRAPSRRLSPALWRTRRRPPSRSEPTSPSSRSPRRPPARAPSWREPSARGA